MTAGDAKPPSSGPPPSPTTLIPHDEATVPCATCWVVPGDIVDLLAVVTAAVALHNSLDPMVNGGDPRAYKALGAALRNLGVPEDES